MISLFPANVLFMYNLLVTNKCSSRVSTKREFHGLTRSMNLISIAAYLYFVNSLTRLINIFIRRIYLIRLINTHKLFSFVLKKDNVKQLETSILFYYKSCLHLLFQYTISLHVNTIQYHEQIVEK